MKYLVLFSAVALLGCTKEPAPATPYAQINIKDKENEQILADVTGQWKPEQGELFLNAEGENGEMFAVHLEHVFDAKTLQPSIKAITYTDGYEFYPSSVVYGNIVVDKCNNTSIDCSFNVTLHEERYNTSLTLTGKFGVRNPN